MTTRKGGRTRRTDDRVMIGGVMRRCTLKCPARGCRNDAHRWAFVVVEPPVTGSGRGRKRWVGKFATETEAKTARRAAVVEVGKPTYVRPAVETLATVADRWLKRLVADGRKGSTVTTYDSAWRRHIRPALGGRPVGKVTAADCSALYASLVTDKGLKPSTVRLVAATLSAMLTAAVEWRLIPANPCRHARLPGQRSGRGAASTITPIEPDKVWTGKELGRFLAGIAELPGRAVSVLAAATGMRRGELTGLHWDDVDLDVGSVLVRVNRARIRRLDGTWTTEETSPKSGRTRTVMLDADTTAVLRALREQQRGSPLVSLAERRDRGGHVFLTEAGQPMAGAQAGALFDGQVAAVAGLRRIGGIHSLRHTHASVLLANGEPVATVAKRLGDTIAVIEKTYAHWIQDADERAAATWAQAVQR